MSTVSFEEIVPKTMRLRTGALLQDALERLFARLTPDINSDALVEPVISGIVSDITREKLADQQLVQDLVSEYPNSFFQRVPDAASDPSEAASPLARAVSNIAEWLDFELWGWWYNEDAAEADC